ncbi:hypothetical protein OAO50_08390, partial [Paracoccaceae bacterium]|nr:hypothetical protein [Paracoccaceae bacterium]
MSDTVTIITSATGNQIVKSFGGPDNQQLKFSPGLEFLAFQHPVDDLQSLASVIGGLEDEPTKAVIRGLPLLSESESVARQSQNFSSTPHHWCMIDIDSLPWDGDLQDQKAMLAYATSQLPVTFQQADCWYHFSSSMGIKVGIRVHMWYWLERPCSDAEMKAWLSGCPVDLRLFNPIQIHLTANPHFMDGATDRYLIRSGMFEAGHQITIVTFPDDLESRAVSLRTRSKPRSRSKSGSLDPAEVVRDPDTGLAIDGREQLMFLLSNEVMREMVTAVQAPSEDDLTEALWTKFCQEADISIVNERGSWTIADARSKARARLAEHESGYYSFVSRSDRTTLVAGSGKVKRPALRSVEEAEVLLNDSLTGFFSDLADSKSPRLAVRITMGTGKTTKAIEHLKQYLASRHGQNIEVYVPRHDLADEWEQGLDGINARVVHVYPRTGGKWDENSRSYAHPIMCHRADYVRDLEANGHSIYGNACLSRASGEQCGSFSECQYLDQFRISTDDIGHENTIRIYTHASLFLSRNEYERQITSDLVIIDEAFLSSAVSNMPSVSVDDVIRHVRLDEQSQLGFDLVECLRSPDGDMSYLRDKDIGSFELEAVRIDHLNPAPAFNAEINQSRNVKSAKLYKNLTKLIEQAVREIEDASKDRFEQLAYDDRNKTIVVCEHKPIRVPRSSPVLYLDATADPVITEAYLPALEHQQIDVKQRAVVSQVFDRTGSNTFWNDRIDQEKINLTSPEYDHQHNDLSAIIMILNEWIKAGESPLLVGHQGLCEFLRSHPRLDQGVAVAHFGSLRGTNEYEKRSVIFITGRNQPPLDDIERQARAVFANSGNPLSHDDLDTLPTEQVEYWLSDRSPHKPSAISRSAFSDPRIEAIQGQIREAETIQAVARLRLVRADYQKRIFLLSNLPAEMPVDHLIGFNNLMPDKLEMELIKQGDIPLSPLGLERMRPDLGYSGAKARMLFQPDRSKASNPKSLLSSLPVFIRTSAIIAIFKAGNKRKTTH